MKSRYAVFVDAGYLIAAGGWSTVGQYKRGQIIISVSSLIAWIKDQTALDAADSELLRIYWYDAAPRKEATPEQQEVARQTDTKLRLGSLNQYGVQKGVDALLLVDMMDLAMSKGVDLAFLISGDEDLVEAVKRIQSAGIRLHLWGVETPRNTVSVELRREADRFRLLNSEELGPFFTGPEVNEAPSSRVPGAPTTRPTWMTLPLHGGDFSPSVTVGGVPPITYADIDPERAYAEGRRFAQTWFPSALFSDLEALKESRRQMIPYQIDARLLTSVCRALGIDINDQLDFDARTALRNGFWDEIERLDSENA